MGDVLVGMKKKVLQNPQPWLTRERTACPPQCRLQNASFQVTHAHTLLSVTMSCPDEYVQEQSGISVCVGTDRCIVAPLMYKGEDG